MRTQCTKHVHALWGMCATLYVDCQQPDVYMGTAALKDELILHRGVLDFGYAACGAAVCRNFGNICVFFGAFCCTLPKVVRSCLRQHLEQTAFTF